jgi:GT2 family glycosyltransferase
MVEVENEIGMSVVLPNFNGRELLSKNLPSLYKALKELNLPFEVIVADDCSTDDSVEFLKNSYTDVINVSTPENSGFSTACNTGIAQVRYRYCCVVNTDVTFDPDYFTNSIAYFANPNLFAVKGDIINYRERLDNVLNIDKDSVLYFKRGFIKYKPAEKRNTVSYDHSILKLGCCFICRTDMLKKLGGYDERFSPFFWEDIDLPLTALEQGYELKYAEECKVYHQTSSTISKSNSDIKTSLISKRNKFMLAWKHLGTPRRWAVHVFFVVASLCFRWIGFDWRYYVSFSYALTRYREKLKTPGL